MTTIIELQKRLVKKGIALWHFRIKTESQPSPTGIRVYKDVLSDTGYKTEEEAVAAAEMTLQKMQC